MALTGLRSGDGPLSVRARPSSLKHDCDRRPTSTGRKFQVNAHAKSCLTLEPLRTLRSEDKGQAGACPDRTRAIPCKVQVVTEEVSMIRNMRGAVSAAREISDRVQAGRMHKFERYGLQRITLARSAPTWDMSGLKADGRGSAPFRRDCSQDCSQATRRRPTHVDNSGISAQPTTGDGRSWTTCPLLRIRCSRHEPGSAVRPDDPGTVIQPSHRTKFRSEGVDMFRRGVLTLDTVRAGDQGAGA